MNTQKKGVWRGIMYPLIAFGLHYLFVAIIGTGWLSDAGALMLTGIVGHIDHTILPATYL